MHMNTQPPAPHAEGDSHAQMSAYYASRAPYYDAVYDKPERRADIAFLSKHLSELYQGRTVLEVACGTGYWTPHIAARARRVVATDATAEPLGFARVRPGTETVEFLQCDAYLLPEALGQFDAAFAGLWFSHIPVERRHAFLIGLTSRLAPGARVCFIDNSVVQCRDFPIVETDTNGNTYQHRPLRDGSVHRVLKNFPSETELRALLAPFGRDIEYCLLENFWLVQFVATPAVAITPP